MIDTEYIDLNRNPALVELISLSLLIPIEEKPAGDCNYGCTKDYHPCGRYPTTDKEEWYEKGRKDERLLQSAHLIDKILRTPSFKELSESAKEEWGEADFQALFAGYYSSQNKIREFIHRAEKEAVQKSHKDWLREEIERLEGMKKNFLEVDPDNIQDKEAYYRNLTLSDIQDHYQKELNQK